MNKEANVLTMVLIGKVKLHSPQVQRAEGDEEYHPPGSLTVLPPLQDPGKAHGVLRDQSQVSWLHSPGGSEQ